MDGKILIRERTTECVGRGGNGIYTNIFGNVVLIGRRGEGGRREGREYKIPKYGKKELYQINRIGGEIKLKHPCEVARFWSLQKNVMRMNDENLSRRLRFYYDGNILSKVSEGRYVYQFSDNTVRNLGNKLRSKVSSNTSATEGIVEDCPFSWTKSGWFIALCHFLLKSSVSISINQIPF